MKKREKVKQIYNKLGIIVGEDYIDGIMENKERLEGMMRLWKEEEIDSMNYIFGKSDDNKYFTEFEIELASKIDLFDRQVIKVCKNIWENRENEETLNSILEQLKVGASKCI